MSDDYIKQFSLDELLELFEIAKKNLALSRQLKQGDIVIEQNKAQLERLQKAIVDKREKILYKIYGTNYEWTAN